jgi:hypothetical protein
MRTMETVKRALPLCMLMLAMAAKDDCTINIGEGEGEGQEGEGEDGEGEDGEGEADVCPALACAEDCGGNYLLDEEGCPTCGCDTCEPDYNNVPDCVDVRWNIDGCFWECGVIEGDCSTDADCGDGGRCDFGGAAQRPACNPDSPDCDDGLVAIGYCVYDAVGCNSDADCGLGFACVFSGADPAPPPPDGAEDPIAPPAGICVAVAINCSSDADCQFGQICDFSGVQAALIALPAGFCVDAPSCLSSDECPAGYVCTLDGGADAAPAIPCAIDDPDCGGFGAGFCVPVDECGGCPAGEACIAVDTNCAEICEITPDGEEVCLPCDSFLVFECQAVVDECDNSCVDGEICSPIISGCEEPACEITPDGEVCFPCDPIVEGWACEAVTDPCGNTCNDAQVCVDVGCGGGAGRAAPPVCDDPASPDCFVCNPEFVCQDVGAAPCESDADCPADMACLLGADGRGSCG